MCNFSKVLQEDDIDILEAFTSLLRTVKAVNQLSDKPLEHWKTYNTTIKKITTTSSGGKAETTINVKVYIRNSYTHAPRSLRIL